MTEEVEVMAFEIGQDKFKTTENFFSRHSVNADVTKMNEVK